MTSAAAGGPTRGRTTSQTKLPAEAGSHVRYLLTPDRQTSRRRVRHVRIDRVQRAEHGLLPVVPFRIRRVGVRRLRGGVERVDLAAERVRLRLDLRVHLQIVRAAYEGA